MPATVSVQLLLESLVEAITSLELPKKQQLLEILEQQLFEMEEENYEEHPETVVEIQAVRAEYDAGEYQTFEAYRASRSTPAS
ncbi:MAG: hypothetical protein LH679_17900 [Cyanobacteria bacterium CAN_BIN43]|jgi:hypothetical protein|nr:hypothetical protein [Cyanobacteria bacterium CAN_BIN43]